MTKGSSGSKRSDSLEDSQYQELFMCAPLPYQSLDEDGNILLVNKAWLKALGYDKEKDVIGKWFGDFLAPGFSEHFKENFPKFKEAGKIDDIELKMVRKDGKIIDVSYNCQIARDENGNFVRTHCIFADITERKKLEQAIERSEALLNATQQLTKVGGWEWDIEKQTMFWTDEAYQIHDFERDEFAPGSTEHIERGAECYDPEDRPIIMEAFNNCIEKGKAYDLEFPFTTSKGRRIWIRTVANPVMKDKKVVKVIGNIMDITDLREKEKALNLEKERAETYLKIAGVMMVAINSDGIVTMINSKGCEILGYDESEIVGKNWFDNFLPERLRAEVLEVSHKILRGDLEPVRTYTNPVLRKDGTERIILWEATFIYDDAGEITGHLSSGMDITDSEKTKEALKESDRLFNLITDNMEDEIWLMDMDMNVTFMTPSVERYRGYSLEDMQKMNWTEHLTPESLEVAIEALELALTPENFSKKDRMVAGTNDLEYYCKNRATVWSETTISLIRDKNGDPTGLLGVAHDITERKKAEEELLKNEYYLTKAQEIGRIGTWELNIVDNILIWTDENYKIFGVPLGTDMDLDKFFNCIHPDDREYVAEEWTKGMKNNNYDIEHRLIVDGQVRWVREKANIEYDKKGKPIMAIGFTQDITERKEAGEALQKSEQRHRLIYETSGDAIMTLEPPEWRFTSGNNKIVEIFGVKDEEQFLSLTPWQFSPEYQPDGQLSEKKAKEMIDTAMRDGENFFEWTHKRFEGEEFYATVLLNKVEDGDRTFLQARVRDITERKKAEEELEENKERYRNLFNMISDAIYLIDQETGSIMDVNDTACEMYGYTRDEWLTMKNTDVSAESNETQKATSEPPEGIPLRYHKKKDGTVFPLEMTLSAFELQGRKVILAAARDITERNKAEKALQEANDIINRSPAVAFLWKNTVGWPVEFVSENVEELFGYTAKEFISGKISYGEIVHIDDLGKVADEVQRNCEYPDISSFRHDPYRIITKEGQEKWVQDITQIRRNEDGEVAHFEGVVYDITEQKKAEEAMEESEERFRNLFNSSPEGIAIIGTDGTILDYNPAQEKLSNMPREDIIGKTFMDLQHINEDDLEDLGDMMADVLSGKDTEPFELQININDEPIWVEIFPALIKKGEKIEGIQVITRDITDRIRAECAMRESEYKFRAVFHEALDGIALMDADNGIIVDCNPQFEEISGRTLTELRRLHIWDIRPEELMEKAKEMFHTLKEHGIGQSSEHYVERPDGTMIPIEFKARIINVRGNDYILSINRDITERLEAEKVRIDKEVMEAKYTMTKIMTDIVPALLRLGPQMAAGKSEVNREIMRRVDEAFFDKYFPRHILKDIDIETYGKQICSLFNDMGGVFEYSMKGDTLYLEAQVCPWQNQEVKNPMLCMLGRGIVERFGTKIFDTVAVHQENNLVDKAEYCKYEMKILS
ncbi:MAG: PAS domain S-box protein [Thermoplasmata archaeon]|nr:PAS domain S-box protein [Thermoplasmata archaeon]